MSQKNESNKDLDHKIENDALKDNSNIYRYKDLDQLIEEEENNFYGIIYDATYPSKETVKIDKLNDKINKKSKNIPKYIAVIKLISPKLNWITNPENLNEESIHVIFKSNNLKEFPQLSDIGSIIRIHRGVFRPKKRKNVYLNLANVYKIRSSWVIFASKFNLNYLDGENSIGNYQPIGSLTNKFSFSNEDIIIVESLRKWSINYFSLRDSLNYPKSILIKNINNICKKSNENDLLGIITKLESLDNININNADYNNTLTLKENIKEESIKQIETKPIISSNTNNNSYLEVFYNEYDPPDYKLSLMDESGIADILIYKNRLGNKNLEIQVGDYIRIRSIKICDNTVSLNVFSSIMRLPLNCFCLNLFYEKIISQYNDLSLSQNIQLNSVNSELKEENQKKSKSVGKISELEYSIVINNIRLGTGINESKLYIVNSEEDFINFIKDSKEYCKLKFSILKLNSKNPSKIIFGKVKNEILSLEEINLKNLYASEYFYNAILTVRLNQNSINFIDVILNTKEYEGVGFMGVEPGDVLNDYSLYSKISSSISRLLGKDKYADVVLKKIICNQNSIDKKVEFHIVGDYNNLIFD